MQTMPKSVSPALVPVKPMTAVTGGALPNAKPDSTLQSLGYTQLTGSATQVVASPDGSIWVLSTLPAGTDKYIYHYVKGVWTEIPGLAREMAPAPDGSLYVINTAGATYHYNYGHAGAGWTSLGGGATSITVASDGSVYVISNSGSGPDYGIWQNTAGTWTQLIGQGVSLAASADWGTFTTPNGTISPDGLYVLNSAGLIYYANISGTTATYVGLTGAASSLAPTTSGGIFALAAPATVNGTPLYYYDLATNSWTEQPGSGVSLSSNGAYLYVVNSTGGIYQTSVTPVTQPAPNATLPPEDFVTGGGTHYWAASTPATAFGFPVQSGYSGDGRTVAIVIDAVPSMADMTYYLNHFGIKRTGQITERPVDGGGATDDANGGEATLDAETIAGIAPGANVVVYDIPDLSNIHIEDAYNAILSDGRAQVVNLSFGGCEYSGAKTVENPIFNSMNAAGIAVSAASGDTGNDCYFSDTNFPFGPQSPASDPNVIGVGGTNTDNEDTPADIVTSAIWDDCSGQAFGTNCISGGGISTFFATPSYQNGLAGASQSGRNIPDISFPGNNAIIRLAAGWYSIGGTSWSSPLNAGLLAEIYQYCNTTSIPNAVKMYYDTFGAVGYSAFSDVTAGNDLYITSTDPSYSAATGFDNVGGIGQPNGMAVAQHICPGHVLSPLSTGVRVAAAVTQLPAEARTYDNTRDLSRVAGLTDLGVRSSSAPTTVGILLRNTSTIHADEQAVVAALQAAGFTITQRFSNAMLVDAQAPASVVSRYFATSLHDYAQVAHGTRFSNTSALTIPATIAPYVQGIVSDDLVTKAHGPLHLTRQF
jgi:hypothetical protein